MVRGDRGAQASQAEDLAPLTQPQIREIKRPVRDLDARRRYLLLSVFSSRFALYCDVSSDGFVMNDPSSVFEPLRDPVIFRSFAIHPEFHTLVWPNGADLAPEFLHDNVRVTA